MFVSLLCDPFSCVAWHLAADDGIVEELVGVRDHGTPAWEVVLVDRGVGASGWLAGGNQRRVSRSGRHVLQAASLGGVGEVAVVEDTEVKAAGLFA